MRLTIYFLVTLLFTYHINHLHGADTRSGIQSSSQLVIEHTPPFAETSFVLKEPISYQEFTVHIFGDDNPYHVGLIEKGFKGVQDAMPTHSFAQVINLLINQDQYRPYLLTFVSDMIPIIGSVQPENYLSYATHVWVNFMGPYHLSREAAIKDYCMYVNAPVYQAPSAIQEQQARFIATAFSQRPIGSLAPSHLLKVMRIFAKLNSVDEYEQFSSFAQSLPHYDSYHYLLTLETMAKIKPERLNETFRKQILDYAKRNHPQKIPYELMRSLESVLD